MLELGLEGKVEIIQTDEGEGKLIPGRESGGYKDPGAQKAVPL